MTSPPPPKPKPAPYRILIVEDELQLAAVLQKGLEKAGFQVQHATSVEAATPLLETYLPHVLLLDGNLPGANGLNLGVVARNSPKFKGTRIIAMSGDPLQKEAAEMLRSQYDLFLVKPFKMIDLLEGLAHVLAKR